MLEDRTEVEKFVSTPVTIYEEYEKPSLLHESLKQELKHIRDKVIHLDSILLKVLFSVSWWVLFIQWSVFLQVIQAQHSHLHRGFRDVENSKVTKKKDINKVHRNIEYRLDDLGLFCAYAVYCMHWSIIVVKN